MDSKIFSENFSVTVWQISQLSWENLSYAAEVITEKWHVYKTWVLSEHNFQCLAQQRLQDRIKEIKIMRGNEEEFLSSKLISEMVKSKFKQIISI